jgi:hypothetical protein
MCCLRALRYLLAVVFLIQSCPRRTLWYSLPALCLADRDTYRIVMVLDLIECPVAMRI